MAGPQRNLPPLPEHSHRTTAQRDLDALHRRLTLAHLIKAVHRHRAGTLTLVRLVSLLDLDEELDGLIEGHPERQQRVAAARELLDDVNDERVE